MPLQLLEVQEISRPPALTRKVRSATGKKNKGERDARGALLAYIAQELRTPLNAMVAMADLLNNSQLAGDQREMVGVLRRSGEHLVGVVNNALDWARLEAGTMELEVRPIELRLCIEECLDRLATEAAEKGIDLSYDMSDSTPEMIWGDGVRLRQILENLLANALAGTGTGNVVVSVETGPVGAQYEIRFAVSHLRAGDPPDQSSPPFPEWHPADDDRIPRTHEGDLGLSISRRLAEMMGGEILVERGPGIGTTLWFTIPAREAEAKVDISTAHPPLTGKRVLIVDANPSVGRLLSRTAGQWGIEARASTDLAEALEVLRAGERVDAVLIDGRFPDRRAFTSAIRRLPGGEALPLVLLTSLNTRGLDEALAGTGGRARFAAYLSKPIRRIKLREVLVRVLAPLSSRSDSTVVQCRPRPRVSQPVKMPAPVGSLAGVRVVIADDEPLISQLLEHVLSGEGAQVVSAADGVSALEEVRRHEPDVILLDETMPGLNGIEVLRRLKNDTDTRLTPVVLLTGLGTREDRIRGLDAGADDILTKPLERSELLARVRGLARLKRFTRDLDRVEGVLVAMARCMESRDPDTHGHCERLSDHAARLGERLGLEEADINALRLAGIVHDIGKIAVPDAILFKDGPLTGDEWAVMREHPVEGERICSGLSAFRRVLPMIRHHHEKMDGSGYPDRLRGSEIPITARVLQIVDIYDALTTRRHYSDAVSPAQALEVLQTEVERGWRDGEIFEVFREVVLQDAAMIT